MAEGAALDVGPGSPGPTHLGHDRRRDLSERAIGWALLAGGAPPAVVTAGIVFLLLRETVTFFSHVSILEFFTETRWTPQFETKHFGVLPLMAGSPLIAAAGRGAAG